MGKLGGSLTAEFMKMRRTWLLWIHLVMPLAGIVVFLLYYRISAWSDWGKISGYMEVLSAVSPTLAGIICALAADQEKQAGHLQNLLGGTESRTLNVGAKLGMLLLWNLAAMLLAVTGFGAGFWLWVSKLSLPGSFYFVLTALLWLPQILSYCFHFFLGLRFSKGVTIGVGIVESLLASLLMTGLGEGIWQYFPCAWAGRLTRYYVLYINENINSFLLTEPVKVGIILMGVFTLAGTVLMFSWVHVYEGSQAED